MSIEKEKEKAYKAMKVLNKMKQKMQLQQEEEHKKIASEAKKCVNPPFSHIANPN